jgi:hypothetical protein
MFVPADRDIVDPRESCVLRRVEESREEGTVSLIRLE